MNEQGFHSESEFGVLHISSNEEKGFRPYMLLVSSIAGCSGGLLRNVLTKMRIPFEDIHISAQVKRNPDQANRLEGIHLSFTIYGENLPPEKVQKAMELARKHCSMIESVKDSIHVTEELNLKSK